MIRIITYILFSLFGMLYATAQITSEEILLNNDGFELSGTLSYTSEKPPLIIWVHGSGNVDRNGNQSGVNIKANYIKQLRDSLNKKNISFFSFDKRTANQRNTVLLNEGVLFEDFVSDVKKVVSYFKKEKRFQQMILIGHSQGSLVGLLASENTTKYISLAGPSKSIDQVIINQLKSQNVGLSKVAEAHFKELKETGAIKEVNPMLVSIFSLPNLPFFKSWMQYNPSEEIKKINMPVLILNGTKDLQVSEEEAKELHAANKNSELVIIESMNHVLKEILKDDDNLKSYYSADYKISSQLIETIVSFIKK